MSAKEKTAEEISRLATIDALLHERAGYVARDARGLDYKDRIAQVDAELKKLGYDVKKAAKETTVNEAPEKA